MRVGAAALSAGMALSGCDAGKTKTAEHGSGAVQRSYATLAGQVKNRRGGNVLAGTTISVTSTDQANGRYFQKSMPADKDGRYFIDLLEPGSYSVGFNYADGRETGGDERTVRLEAGEDAKVDVVLDLRTVEQAMPYGAPPGRRRIV